MVQSTIYEEKTFLRQKILRKRNLLNTEERLLASRLMYEQFIRSDFIQSIKQGSTVALYWPIQSEIDCRPLFSYFIQKGIKTALPRLEKGSMVFRLWDNTMPLVQGIFGLKEPEESQPIVLQPDVIFTPLCAWDRSFQRLGYGKGYYDRTLAHINQFKHPYHVIGLAYAMQEVLMVPVEAHDYLLDGIITDHEFLLR